MSETGGEGKLLWLSMMYDVNACGLPVFVVSGTLCEYLRQDLQIYHHLGDHAHLVITSQLIIRVAAVKRSRSDVQPCYNRLDKSTCKDSKPAFIAVPVSSSDVRSCPPKIRWLGERRRLPLVPQTRH